MKLHISAEDYWHNITPLELTYMFKAYNENKENDNRFSLCTMRLQTMILINSQLKTHQQIRDPKRFLKFYWEDELIDDVEILSEDEWDAIDKKLGLKK